MHIMITTYLLIAFAALAALTLIILKIGQFMSDCPDGNPAARTAALSIATGFAAIGAGIVALIAAGVVMADAAPLVAALAGAGLAVFFLGLGFTQAVTTLRDVLCPDARKDMGLPQKADA